MDYTKFHSYDIPVSGRVSVHEPVSDDRLFVRTSKIKNEELMSQEDFRRRTMEHFRKVGKTDTLKAIFRAELLGNLCSDKRGIGIEFKKPDNLSLKRRALDGAVANYLKKANYTLTLSVFVSDAKIKDSLTLNDKDVLKMLGVTNTSNLPMSTEGPLVTLVDFVEQINNTKKFTMATQTESAPDDQGIDGQLRRLDQDYLMQLEHYKRKTELSTEEKFAQYQRDVDRRANDEISSKIKLFEETTLNAMRLEENAKCRERISSIKDELDKDYMRKCSRLSARERQVMERLEAKEKEVQKLQYQQRQEHLTRMEELHCAQSLLRSDKLEIERSRKELEDRSKRLDSLQNQNLD
ncbi:hypothetical protein AKO1_001604 [Acrasis kona]|uniref:Uncharacterized protein n=1 Tax=Acrasis kona TaxID=1008807 RepID=A0AAW2ZC37_9EUKA